MTEATDYISRIRSLERKFERQLSLIQRIDKIVEGKNDETSIAVKNAFGWYRTYRR